MLSNPHLFWAFLCFIITTERKKEEYVVVHGAVAELPTRGELLLGQSRRRVGVGAGGQRVSRGRRLSRRRRQLSASVPVSSDTVRLVRVLRWRAEPEQLQFSAGRVPTSVHVGRRVPMCRSDGHRLGMLERIGIELYVNKYHGSPFLSSRVSSVVESTMIFQMGSLGSIFSFITL